MPDALTDYLFERRYEQVDADGDRRVITLQIAKPYLLDRSESIWACRWCLIGLDETQGINSAQGRDALDALLSALKVAHVYLTSNVEPTQDRLYWLGNIPGTGLPTAELFDAELPLPEKFSSVFEEVVEAFFKNFKHRHPPHNSEND